jgi:hypothetical protein
MSHYQIIETDAGLTVTEQEPNVPPEVVAEQRGGVLVDPGPYKTFDDAYDAILALQREEDDAEGPQ